MLSESIMGDGGLSVKLFCGILLHFSIIVQDTMCLTVSRLPFLWTKNCPQNQTAWNERATAINCSETEEYLCIPNAQLTDLFEICLPFYSIKIKKGVCLTLLKKSTLKDYDCHAFVEGCPDKNYNSNDMYKYPHCAAVKEGCFLADPFCGRTIESTLSPEDPSDKLEENNIFWLLIFVCTPTIMLLIILCYKLDCVILTKKAYVPYNNRNEEADMVVYSRENVHELAEIGLYDNKSSKMFFSQYQDDLCAKVTMENEIDEDLLKKKMKEMFQDMVLRSGGPIKVHQTLGNMMKEVRSPMIERDIPSEDVPGLPHEERPLSVCTKSNCCDLKHATSLLNGDGREKEVRQTMEVSHSSLKSLSVKNLKVTLEEMGVQLGVRKKLQQALEDMKTQVSRLKVERDLSSAELHLSSQSVESYEKSSDDLCLPLKEVRILLLGTTGCGKSATGNSILGANEFKVKLSGVSDTRNCSLRRGVRFNKRIVLIDTPGIFDTTKTNELIEQEIFRCINLSSPGPHAFILVLNITRRFTNEEEQTVHHFVKYFGEEINKYFLVLFPRKGELDRNNETLKTFIDGNSQNLKSFIAKCDGRAFAMENTLKGEVLDKQVNELLNMILRNVENNKGECYTNEMYEKTERELKKIESKVWEANMKKREKEFKVIEERIVKKYQQKAEEEEKNLKKLRSQLREQINKSERNNDQVVALTKEVEKCELEIKEGQSESREELQISLDRLHKQLVEKKAEESEKARKLDELTKTRNESVKRIERKFHEMLKEEIDKAYQDYIEQEKVKNRDEIREEVAAWPAELLKKGLNWGYEMIAKLFTF